MKEGVVPSLMEFEGRFYGKLEFPPGLKHLKTLRLIKLHKMPKPFMKDNLNRKKTLLDDVGIDYNWWIISLDFALYINRYAFPYTYLTTPYFVEQKMNTKQAKIYPLFIWSRNYLIYSIKIQTDNKSTLTLSQH